MKYHNLFINNLNKKDVKHFTTDIGLFIRKKTFPLFRRLCNFFTHATIFYTNSDVEKLLSRKQNANNIVVQNYPNLKKDESYIFVGSHVCPEDIETMINVLDRNAYLVLGSVENLHYNPEVYLSWINGLIVFDVLNKTERKELISKMERVLKTQSILIFPEGSHNYDFNKLIKPLYDGPINLAIRTGKKIVPIVMIKDYEKKVAYIDVGNPIDVTNLNLNIQDYYPGKEETEKYRIKAMSSYLRDLMATTMYEMMEHYFTPLKRKDYEDLGEHFIEFYVKDTFQKINWRHDVFDAEYLTKITEDEQAYEEVVQVLSNLKFSKQVLKETRLNTREYVLQEIELKKRNVVQNLRNEFYKKLVDEKNA